MKNREVIEEMYYSYLEKRKIAKDTIIQNENRIKEIEIFLDSVNEKDLDFKYFSPLSTDSIFDGKIDLEKTERENLLEDNKVQLELIKDLDVRIQQFKEMLDDSKPSASDVDTINEVINHSFSFDDESNINIGKFLIEMQEQERFRISSELHDETVQTLVHIGHSIELSSKFIDQDPIRAKLELESCAKNLRETVNGIRDIIFNLRPMSFDDLGFKRCVDDYVTNLKVQYPNVVFDVEIDEIEAPSEFLMMLFRIIQESVINSLKHSRSSDLMLHVKRSDDNINILVKDSGIGFNPDNVSSGHFGLSILQERIKIINGKMDINSVIDEGTQINITIAV